MVLPLVRVISISDEVYVELSRIKNGKSFTQVIKSLMEQCQNKGNPQKILEFLNTHEPLSEEDAKEMIEEVDKGRKRASPRNLLIK
jgi:predicted CopG family antitoxin